MEIEEQSNPEQRPEAKTRKSGWGRTFLIAGSAVVVLGGIGAVAAKSGDFGRQHGMGRHMMDASMGGGHGRGHGHGFGFGEGRMERMLEGIDATPEQAEKLKAIFGSVREQVGPMMEDFRNSRSEVADILGAATIDRAAAEKLRSERVAAIDTASRTMTTALLDAAEILTPEQRAKLVEHFKERGDHHKW